MPADGMFAAYCHDRDFGTSRWAAWVKCLQHFRERAKGGWGAGRSRTAAHNGLAVLFESDRFHYSHTLPENSGQDDDRCSFRQGFSHALLRLAADFCRTKSDGLNTIGRRSPHNLVFRSLRQEGPRRLL